MASISVVRSIVEEFRKTCLERYPCDVVPGDVEGIRSRTFGGGEDFEDLLDFQYRPPIHDISALLSNPRSLKFVLRGVYRIWEDVHGEVDFDDLLFLHSIKICVPSVFQYLDANLPRIRGLDRAGMANDVEARRSAINSELSNVISGSDLYCAAVRNIVDYLLPSISGQNDYGEGVQRVCRYGVTDYWGRAASGAIPATEVRDQVVLRLISSVISSGSADDKKILVESLINRQDFSDKFEVLASKVCSGSEIRYLASLVLRGSINEFGVSSCRDYIRGFSNLWRIAIARPVEDSAHHEWFLSEARIYLKSSFRLFNDFYYFWAWNSKYQVDSKASKNEVRGRIINTFKDFYSESPGEFAKIIDPYFMYSSYHFCILFSEERQGGDGFKAEKWRWYADLLLAAAKYDEVAIVPQIVGLLTNEKGDPFDGFSAEFDKDLLDGLFGDRADQALRVMAKGVALEGFSSREANRLVCAFSYARDALK